MEYNKIVVIDTILGLKSLEDNSIDCIITSPPYNKCGKERSKGANWNDKIDYDSYDDNMPEEEYQKWQINFLNECFRVLKPTGSMFYNHKRRRRNNEIITPDEWLFKTEFKMNQLIIWDRKSSPNVSNYYLTPVTEYFYWLVKSDDFKCFLENVPEQYRSNIWTMTPERNVEHPAPFNILLPELCLKLTTEEGDVVLDPFMGSGSTGVAAKRNKRKYYGFDISQNYANISNRKIDSTEEYVEVPKIKEEIIVNKDIKTAILSDDDITSKLIEDIYENLLDDGSMFVRFKDINFLNTEKYNLIIKNKFKKYQLIIVKTNDNIVTNNKLISNTEYILWFSKKVPEKFKTSMKQEYRKEVWEINCNDVDYAINDNLCILTTNIGYNKSNEKNVLVVSRRWK